MSDIKSLKAAAEQGDAIAQFNLGNIYFNGRGVTQSDVEAVKWYKLAADQGDARGQSRLGLCMIKDEALLNLTQKLSSGIN